MHNFHFLDTFQINIVTIMGLFICIGAAILGITHAALLKRKRRKVARTEEELDDDDEIEVAQVDVSTLPVASCGAVRFDY